VARNRVPVLQDRAGLTWPMALQTQVEFAQLCNELGALSRRDITQGIKLAKYKSNARSMLKKDAVAANTLLGLVACLEHDIASMHAYHAKAIEISESCFSLMYYAISLEKSCLWNDSAKYALLALDHEPEDLKLLNTVISIAPLTGRFSLLKRLLSQWQAANSGALHPSQGHFEIVSETLSWHGLLEKDLKLVISAIGDAFSETDAILKQYRYDLVPQKDSSSFIHYRFVLSDQLVASYYEDIIAAKLASLVCHPRIFDAFSFSVENGAVYELYDCMEKELVESADTIRVPDPDRLKLIEELVAGVEI